RRCSLTWPLRSRPKSRSSTASSLRSEAWILVRRRNSSFIRFFQDGWDSRCLAIVLGAGFILYSLLINYELGIPTLRFIPMSVHLTVDFVAAAFLAVAPFLFGYPTQGLKVWLPQVLAGAGVIVLVLVSQTQPQSAYVSRDASVGLARV